MYINVYRKFQQNWKWKSGRISEMDPLHMEWPYYNDFCFIFLFTLSISCQFSTRINWTFILYYFRLLVQWLHTLLYWFNFKQQTLWIQRLLLHHGWTCQRFSDSQSQHIENSDVVSPLSCEIMNDYLTYCWKDSKQ